MHAFSNSQTQSRLARFLVWTIAVTWLAGGCATEGTQQPADTIQCEDGKCDAVGPLVLSTRWAPQGGFIDAALSDDSELRVEPAGPSIRDLGGGRSIVEFPREGFFQVSAVRGDTVRAKIGVRISDQGPRLTLDEPSLMQPQRGAPGTVLAVSGTVTDDLGDLQAVSIDGHETQLRNGQFDGTVPAEFGVNTTEFVVTDAVGTKFTFARSFLAADDFGSRPSTTTIRLGESAIDQMMERVSTRLPGLVEVEAGAIIASRLGTDVIFDGLTLPGKGDNPGSMSVMLHSPQRGQLHATVRGEGVLIADFLIDSLIDSQGQMLLKNPEVEIDLVFLEGPDGPRVETRNATLSDDGLEFEVDLFPDWAANLAADATRQSLKDSLAEMVPTLLGDALRGVNGTPMLPGQGPLVSATLEYQLVTFVPDPAGLEVAIETTVAVEDEAQVVLHPDEPGPAPTEGNAALALGYDVVNQWLVAQWTGGAFDYAMTQDDFSDALNDIPGLADRDPRLDILITTDLPPVVSAGSNGGVQLAAGRVQLEAFVSTDLLQFTVKAQVAVVAEMSLAVDGGEIAAEVAVSEILVELEVPTFGGLDSEATERLLQQIATEAANRYGAQIERFPLPTIRLDGVGLNGVVVSIDNATVTAGPGAMRLSGEIGIGEES